MGREGHEGVPGMDGKPGIDGTKGMPVILVFKDAQKRLQYTKCRCFCKHLRRFCDFSSSSITAIVSRESMEMMERLASQAKPALVAKPVLQDYQEIRGPLDQR